MARSKLVSGYGLWKYFNPSYYLRRPTRRALLFILFFSVSMVVWYRQILSREYEFEVDKLNEEVLGLQQMLQEVKGVAEDVPVKTFKDVQDNPVDILRRQKVKEAMIHAWSSYEKYAWGKDELQPQTRDGVDGFGGLGATLIYALDTLYIMGLDEQFQKAREWVAILFLTCSKKSHLVLGYFLGSIDICGTKFCICA